MSAAETTDGDVRQLLVTEEVWGPLRSWLERNGLVVKPYPFQGEDDLPTYFLAPKAWQR